MGKKKANIFIYVILGILTVVVLYPLYFIVLNSFKGKFYISKQPFELPKGELFAGLTNYTNGLEQTGLIEAAGWSFFITIVSVVLIIFFTSMTAYYVTRVKGKTTSVLYYLFVFSMVVPFQMVMFTMVDLAARKYAESDRLSYSDKSFASRMPRKISSSVCESIQTRFRCFPLSLTPDICSTKR